MVDKIFPNSFNFWLYYRYMSLLAKFVGGKRVNFTKRGSYTTRAYGAALSHISGPSWHLSPRLKIRGRASGKTFQKVMETKHRVFCKRKLSYEIAPRKRKRMSHNGPDMDYGLQSGDPDMTSDQFASGKEAFLQKLRERVSCQLDQQRIEESTRGQHENVLWRDIRKDYLTASNFGSIIKKRPQTHCHNVVKRLLYGRVNYLFISNTYV